MKVPHKTLVFEEKFDYEGSPRPDVWNLQVGDHWANRELQCYRDDIRHCYVRNGKMTIIATKENDSCPYISARLNTLDKKMWMYGTFVIRAKVPTGKGCWPAIWMMGESRSKQVGWPRCGEIDIMEYMGKRPGMMQSVLHSGAYNHRKNNQRHLDYSLPTIEQGFHDYQLVWTDTSITFYVDNQLIGQFDKHSGDGFEEWPFDQPFYLLINLAVGGDLGGPVDDSALPYVFEIESVKVYQ